MRPKPLSDTERDDALGNIPGWQFSDNAIHRNFKFKNFVDAFAFMTKVAVEAEKLNHHPDWKNVYNKVEVSLNTHDVGGVTELDIKLATAMDKIAGNGL